MNLFFAIVLSIWTAMHAYASWRLVPLLGSVPRAPLFAALVFLWASYPLARLADHGGHVRVARVLEFVGAEWMGTLFLIVMALFAADVVTGFGFALPRAAGAVRLAAAGLAVALAVVANVQAARGPRLVEHEVRLAGLPQPLDGTTLVLLTDAHVGSLLREKWVEHLVERVSGLSPDLVVIGGDLVDGNAAHVEPLVPQLRRLRAPLGVFAVTGNHEFYAGVDESVRLFEDAGFVVLRDAAREAAPGLVMAGVDDLTAGRQFGRPAGGIERALAQRPPGATILVSHTPWGADDAAARGAGLMLCGHTHDGQIFPFSVFVKLTYPLIAGRYAVGGMPVIVSRGVGTWGPPMRLFRRSEIVRVTLRAT